MRRFNLLFVLLFLATTNYYSQTHTVILSKTLSGHTEPVNCLAFSPDGKTLASGSDAYSLLSDSGKFEIIIWDVSNGKIRGHLTGHHQSIQDLSFNKFGTRLVSSDSKGVIKIWSLDGLKEIKTIEGGEWINTVCYTPDGRFILGEFSFEKKVRLWDSESGKLISTLNINEQISSMDISPDGSKIVLSCFGKIQIWSLLSQKQLLSIDKKSEAGLSIKYSSDGKSIAVGLGNGEIKIFDSETLALRFTLQGHFKPVLSLSFSRDNKYLVSGSSDQMAKVWNLRTKKEVKSLVNEHKGWVKSVAFSSTSNLFATTGEDKLIKIWKMQ